MGGGGGCRMWGRVGGFVIKSTTPCRVGVPYNNVTLPAKRGLESLGADSGLQAKQ